MSASTSCRDEVIRQLGLTHQSKSAAGIGAPDSTTYGRQQRHEARQHRPIEITRRGRLACQRQTSSTNRSISIQAVAEPASRPVTDPTAGSTPGDPMANEVLWRGQLSVVGVSVAKSRSLVRVMFDSLIESRIVGVKGPFAALEFGPLSPKTSKRKPCSCRMLSPMSSGGEGTNEDRL